MADSVSKIYKDGSYAALNPDCGEENTKWKSGQIMRMIKRSDLKMATICEIGCGSGGILENMHKVLPPTIHFTGVEPMPEAWAKCSSKAQDRLKFIHSGADQVKETFDLVLLLDVFEHVEDYMGFLRSLRHLGRNFIFHIPLDMTAQMVLRNEPIMRVRHKVGHLHYFSKDTALATLKDTGYVVADWFYSDMLGSASVGWRKPLMQLPRKLLKAISPDFAVRLLGGNPITVLARPD